jgi:hypothetical protein
MGCCPPADPQMIRFQHQIHNLYQLNQKLVQLAIKIKKETKVTGPGVAAVVGQGDRRSVAVVRIYLGVSVKGLE